MLKNQTLLLTLLSCFCCRQASLPPNQVLPDDRFQSLYVALLEEGERHRSTPQDSTKRFRADSILQAFSTSDIEFRKWVALQNRDGKTWQEFYEAVTKRLDEDQKRLTGKATP